jgi:hypothetical protein
MWVAVNKLVSGCAMVCVLPPTWGTAGSDICGVNRNIENQNVL